MEPISMGLMLAAGLGLKLFGGAETASSSKEYNQAQVATIGLEQKVQDQRQHAMVLDAGRRSLENLRRTQQASAMAQSSAINQGALYSSGYQGGQAQIKDTGGWNELGISQNLEIGQNIFGLNSQISQQKIAMANAQQGMQEGQGYSSLGQSIMSAATPFGSLTSGFGNNKSSSGSGSGGFNAFGLY